MSSSAFLDDRTAPTLLAIPKQDWTGLGELGGRQGVNAQLPLSSSEPGAGSGLRPQRNRLLPPDNHVRPPPQSVHQFFFPSRPPITCLSGPFSFLESSLESRGVERQLYFPDCRSLQHAAATCMFSLGFILMVKDSEELSIIFVPLVLSEQTPMVEVFFEELWF